MVDKLLWHIWAGEICLIRESEHGNSPVIGDCVSGTVEEAMDLMMAAYKIPPHQIKREFKIYDKGLFLIQAPIAVGNHSIMFRGPDRKGSTAELDCAGTFMVSELRESDIAFKREDMINMASLHVNAGELYD